MTRTPRKSVPARHAKANPTKPANAPRAAPPKAPAKSPVAPSVKLKGKPSKPTRPKPNLPQGARARLKDMDALFPIILRSVANGTSVRATLRQPGMPHASEFYAYMLSEDHPERAEQYRTARESQAHVLADQLLEIADDDKRDVFLPAAVQRHKLMIHARQWVLARIHPKVYGERLDVTSDHKRLSSGVVVLPAETSE